MSFKDEQDRFRNEADRLQTRVQDLEAKIYDKKVERTDLQRKYQDSVLDGSDAEMKKMKSRLAKVEDDLQQMEEHLALIVSGKHERLQTFLPEAKAAAQMEINEGMDRLNAMIGELRKYKAEYLGHVLRLNEAFRSVEEIAVSYGNMTTMAGKDDRKLVYMPTLNLTSTHAGLDAPIGVVEDEILEAFRTGKVQPWVKLYLEHGVLVETNVEAEAKFRDMRGGN